MKNYTSILIVFTLLLVGFFLSRYVDRSYEIHLDSQGALMQQSTRGAARLIGLYIKEVRRRVDLFTAEEGEIIGRLSRHPADTEMQEHFTTRVKRHFPEFFAFTITDNLGEVLLDDIEGKVASLCQTDIHDFAAERIRRFSSTPTRLAITMTSCPTGRPVAETRAFSFSASTRRPSLKSSPTASCTSHRLILLHREKPGLIEVTADGTRSSMQGEIKLTPEEMTRIGYTADIEGSLWTLAELPAASLFAAYKKQLWRRAASIFLVFLLFSGIMAALIKRADLRRSSAERAVRESRNQLEKRVASRTEQLSTINTQLESEIHERHRAERALKHEIDERRQTEDAMRSLHEITSAHNLPFHERVNGVA